MAMLSVGVNGINLPILLCSSQVLQSIIMENGYHSHMIDGEYQTGKAKYAKEESQMIDEMLEKWLIYQEESCIDGTQTTAT